MWTPADRSPGRAGIGLVLWDLHFRKCRFVYLFIDLFLFLSVKKKREGDISGGNCKMAQRAVPRLGLTVSLAGRGPAGGQ